MAATDTTTDILTDDDKTPPRQAEAIRKGAVVHADLDHEQAMDGLMQL